jgi:hypothetical protein
MFLHSPQCFTKRTHYKIRQIYLRIQTTKRRYAPSAHDSGRRQDRIPGEVATKTAHLTVTKDILNSACSTKEALYMYMDMTNYYLGTPLERYEYVRIPVSIDDIMNEYNLHALVHNGYIYVELRKGMYG